MLPRWSHQRSGARKRSLWWIAYHRAADGIAVNVRVRVDSTRFHTRFAVFLAVARWP
jgi:hypothetical protein